MSAIEAVYEGLSPAERVKWRRAAQVAQDEGASELERTLALDVTLLLARISRARWFLRPGA